MEFTKFDTVIFADVIKSHDVVFITDAKHRPNDEMLFATPYIPASRVIEAIVFGMGIQNRLREERKKGDLAKACIREIDAEILGLETMIGKLTFGALADIDTTWKKAETEAKIRELKATGYPK